MRFGIVAAAMLAASIGGAARADVVMDNLPYVGTSDWTYGAMSPGNTAHDGTTTVFETRPYAGVWFGWGTSYANTPSWSPGSPAAGNYLSLTASFSADAADWSAYFYDTQSTVSMHFNPTFCSAGQDCYQLTPQQGVAFYFGSAGGQGHDLFVPLDTTQAHTFEFLLKDGVVSYRIDGAGYVGAAAGAGRSSPLLVIGDGSGYDPTGVGVMTISAVSFDNAPQFGALGNVTPVPEPGEWAMIGVGLAVAGFAAKRRRPQGAK